MCVEYTPVYNYNFPRRAQQTVKLATRGSGHEQRHRELVLCCTQHQPHHVLHRMSQQRWSSWTRVSPILPLCFVPATCHLCTYCKTPEGDIYSSFQS